MYLVIIKALNDRLPLHVKTICKTFKLKKEIEDSGLKLDNVVEMLGREIFREIQYGNKFVR